MVEMWSFLCQSPVMEWNPLPLASLSRQLLGFSELSMRGNKYSCKLSIILSLFSAWLNSLKNDISFIINLWVYLLITLNSVVILLCRIWLFYCDYEDDCFSNYETNRIIHLKA